MCNNPYKTGDLVSIKRGDGRLTGTVVKTVKARCHVNIDGRVFVENYKECNKALKLTGGPNWETGPLGKENEDD